MPDKSTIEGVQTKAKILANARLNEKGESRLRLNEPPAVKGPADNLRKLFGVSDRSGNDEVSINLSTYPPLSLIDPFLKLEKRAIENLSLAGVFGPGINPENWIEALNRAKFLQEFVLINGLVNSINKVKIGEHSDPKMFTINSNLIQEILTKTVSFQEFLAIIRDDTTDIAGFTNKIADELEKILLTILDENLRSAMANLRSGLIKDNIQVSLSTHEYIASPDIQPVLDNYLNEKDFDKKVKILWLLVLDVIISYLKTTLNSIENSMSLKGAIGFLGESENIKEKKNTLIDLFTQPIPNPFQKLPKNQKVSKPLWTEKIVSDSLNGEVYDILSVNIKDVLVKQKEELKTNYITAGIGNEGNFTTMFQDLIELVEVGAAPYVLPPLMALSAGLFFISPAASVVASTAVSTLAPRLNGSKSTLEFLTVLAKLCNSAKNGNLASKASISSLKLIPGYNNIIQFTSKYLLSLAYSSQELSENPKRIEEQRVFGRILLAFSIGNFK